MSKTVKRVMRVMMVGLIAMLGAKAEAHYIVVKGKVKYCSHCVDALLEWHPDNPPTTHREEVRFSSGQITVDVLCSVGGNVSQFQVQGPLVVRRTISQPSLVDVNGDGVLNDQVSPFDLNNDAALNDIDTEVDLTRDGGTTTAEVEGVISDASFFLVGDGNHNFCGTTTPIDVLVRAAHVSIETFACDSMNPNKCASTGSTFNADCSLAPKFNLKDYPKNLPPIGTRYDCINTEIVPDLP